jgi:hypothetical protein
MSPLPINSFCITYTVQDFLDLNYIFKFFKKFPNNLRSEFSFGAIRIELVPNITSVYFNPNKTIDVITTDYNIANSSFGAIDNWVMNMTLPLRFIIINRCIYNCDSIYKKNGNVYKIISSSSRGQKCNFGVDKSLLPSSI